MLAGRQTEINYEDFLADPHIKHTYVHMYYYYYYY